jgi:hypothetical protein
VAAEPWGRFVGGPRAVTSRSASREGAGDRSIDCSADRSTDRPAERHDTGAARPGPRDVECLCSCLILERIKERQAVHTSSRQVHCRQGPTFLSVYAQGALRAGSRGWVAQARKSSLDATAGWTARARGWGRSVRRVSSSRPIRAVCESSSQIAPRPQATSVAAPAAISATMTLLASEHTIRLP